MLRYTQNDLGMLHQVDFILFRWLNSWVGISDFWDWNIIFRAEYLIYALTAAIFLFLAFDKDLMRVRWVIWHSFLAGLFSRFVLTEIIRYVYNRPRPFEALEGVRQLIFHDGGGSFPSGNAAYSFAIAMAVYFYYPKTSTIFFLVSIAMGAGRVSAGVHWPSDILGGAVVGIASAWILRIVFSRYYKNKSPEGA